MYMDIFNAMIALATDTAPSETETDFYYCHLRNHSQENFLSSDFAIEFIEAYDTDDRAAMFNTIAAYAKFIAEFFEKGK